MENKNLKRATEFGARKPKSQKPLRGERIPGSQTRSFPLISDSAPPLTSPRPLNPLGVSRSANKLVLIFGCCSRHLSSHSVGGVNRQPPSTTDRVLRLRHEEKWQCWWWRNKRRSTEDESSSSSSNVPSTSFGPCHLQFQF